MNRPVAHQTDELAQRIFRQRLPAAWVVNPLTNDYAKDYSVEIADDDGRVTGPQFIVQLKGSNSPGATRAGWAYQMDTRHLAYYVDNVGQPVFVVLVDVKKKRGRWVFVQKYVLNQPPGWRTKRTLRLVFDKRDDLRNVARLRRAIIEANGFVGSLNLQIHPQGLEASSRRLESIDPRFRVTTRLTSNGIDHHMQAKQDVTFKMTLTGRRASIAKKARQLLERGIPIHLTPKEVTFEGTPILETLNFKSIQVQYAHRAPALLHLKRGEAGSVIPLAGDWVAGRREGRFQGRCARCPLIVTFKLPFGVGKPLQRVSFNLQADFGAWTGLPFRMLPYFEQVHSLFEASSPDDVHIRFEVDGNHVFSGYIPSGHLACSAIPTTLGFLSKARQIAKRLNIDLIAPARCPAEEVRYVEEIYDLLTIGTFVHRGRGIDLRLTFARPDKAIDVIRRQDVDRGDDLSVCGTLQYRLLGVDLPPFDVHQSLTRARCKTSQEDIVARYGTGGGAAHVDWESSELSQFTVSLASPLSEAIPSKQQAGP